MIKLIEFIIQRARFLRILCFLLCLPLTSQASQTVYTIQTGSFMDEADAHKQFDSLAQSSFKNNLDHLRIEKIGDYYSVRIGSYENLDSAKKYLRTMNPHLPAALIMKAYIKDERVRRTFQNTPSASPLVYTIQTGSFMNEADAQKQFDSLAQSSFKNNLDHLRIEKIGDYYSVRIGSYDDLEGAEKYVQMMSPHLPAALITKAYIKDERVRRMYKGYLSFDMPEDGETPSSDLEAGRNAQLDNEQTVSETVTDTSTHIQEKKEDAYAKDDDYLEAVEKSQFSKTGDLEQNPEVNGTEEDKTYQSAGLNPGAKVAQSGIEETLLSNSLPENERVDMGVSVKKMETEMDADNQQRNAYAENEGFLLAKEENQQEETDDLDLDSDLEGLEFEGEEETEYKYPEVKPEATLSFGYRLTGSNGLDRAFEFEDLRSFPAADASWEGFKYPHRTHLDVSFRTENDYQVDLRYAYKSILNARIFRNVLYHNLEDIELVDLDSSISSPRIKINDDDDKFWVKSGINHVNLKLKNPNFPIHAYINVFQFNQKGSRQQRSLRGSGYFSDLERLSRNRNIDQVTSNYEIGANSHLGLVEVDYSHNEKRFDVDDDNVMFDVYGATVSRPAGTFPHNQLSELKSSSNKIKIHTNYTGKLIATTTFALKERENRASGANENIFIGEGAVRWMPVLRLSLYLNYSHRDIDPDNPSTASITDSTGSTTTYSTTVKPSVATMTDTVVLTAKYRPESFLTLKAKYLYKHIKRENTELWNLKDSTRKNDFTFTSDAKIKRGLNLKAVYMHKSTDKPSYNSEPYYSNKGSVLVTWLPSPRINLLMDVSTERGERTELDYSETAAARERDIKTDSILGSGTFQLLKDLSLNASYAYFRYEVKQDIVYEDLGRNELVDSGIPYEDSAHIFAVTLNYIPVDKLNLLGQITHTISKGEFEPKSGNLTEPVSIASFSKRELTNTVYHLSGDYDCPGGLTCSLDIKYSDMDDVLDNIYNADEDADAYLILLRVIKKWG